MRLVSWNCNMALDRKFAALLSLRPDIAVIPECAKPDILRNKTDLPDDVEIVWIGDNPNKGLGIFGFNGYRVSLHDEQAGCPRYIAPVKVAGKQHFNLLAVWAHNTKAEGWSGNQKAPFVRATERYRSFLHEPSTVVAGDFNNHVRWDKPGKINNHANAIAQLASARLASAYHVNRGVEHGAENEPTHYWRDRRKDGHTFHIDYVFLPSHWIPFISEMSVGTFEEWCGNKLSDHVPLTVEIDPSAF